MTSFHNIQHLWNQPGNTIRTSYPLEDLIELAEKNTRKIKSRQYWNIGIMGITILFLIGYISIFTGLKANWFHTGIFLMLLSLALRVVIETWSLVILNRIDIRSDFRNYTSHITSFYRSRKIIHYGATPLIFAAYTTGFGLLLPVFMKSFSTAFFMYIVISGSTFLVVFATFMIREIKKEIKILTDLREINI
ncbi:hypothetical protein [Chitinophaga sancti]|uniref:hypothetical protein n=1 Tax=Chitinophaga sancti TaxID=1004 RepID=UPI003F7B228E